MSGIASNSHSTVCNSRIIIPDILFMTKLSGIFCHDEIALSLIRQKCDCTQNPPMSLSRSFHSTQSNANLAQRLLQAGCIIH